jgi:sugar O-acyltransferase (sialic acid O-acetyltransferase NeuD family)
MHNALYAVYGVSGFGREVMPVARRQPEVEGVAADQIVFIDDAGNASQVNGSTVVNFEEFMGMTATERHVSLAVADCNVREKLAIRCESRGIGSWSIIASNAVVMDEVDIGRGAVITPFVTITSNVSIGKYFHANLYSYVAHDCVIGDFVTFAPGVKCNGNVIVEDYAYIGTGAIIKQGKPGRPLRIGKRASVGAGAVVTKNVSPDATVLGNPARVLSKENLRKM